MSHARTHKCGNAQTQKGSGAFVHSCIRAFVHFDERQLTTRCSVSLLTSIFIRCFAFTM